MSIHPDPSSFLAPLCQECDSNADRLLSADDLPCDDCFEKLPESVQKRWERRWKRELEWYSRWLNGEG